MAVRTSLALAKEDQDCCSSSTGPGPAYHCHFLWIEKEKENGFLRALPYEYVILVPATVLPSFVYYGNNTARTKTCGSYVKRYDTKGRNITWYNLTFLAPLTKNRFFVIFTLSS